MKKIKCMLVCIVFAGIVPVMSACGGLQDEVPAYTPEVATYEPAPEIPDDLVPGSEPEAAPVDENDPWALINYTRERVPMAVTNDNPAIDGGTLRVGISTGSSFSGLLDPLFTTTTLDNDAALLMIGPSLFSIGHDLMHSNLGIARIDEWCHDTQSILIVQQYFPVWHDGVPFTLDDLVFAFEVISHPDYTGIRWDADAQNIVGTVELREGTADYISGLVLSEDKHSLRMYFHNWHPALQFPGAFWSSPSPRHHLEHIPVAELASHENVRGNTLGFGPFILESQVPGESKVFVRNENFFLGMPEVESIIYTIIPPASTPLEIQSGNLDIVTAHPISLWYENPVNYQFIGRLGAAFSSWYNFNLGNFNPETGRNELREDATMACIYLRRAISLAFPLQEIGAAVFNGLSIPANNTMNLQHSAFFVPGLNMHSFDPDRARQILDDAGYTFGSDGFRTHPDGSPLVIYLLWQQPGSPAAETNLAMHLQSANDIGINMQLYQGRPHDFQAFVEIINDAGSTGWDIASNSWGGGHNPNPESVWGHSVINRSGWTSERWDAIFETIRSDPRMWDLDFMTELYHEWQHAWFEELPAAVGTISVQLFAANNRVKNFSTMPPGYAAGNMRVPMQDNWWLVQLTADEPYRP